MSRRISGSAIWAIRSCLPPRSWHSTPRIFGVWVPPDGASVGVEAASLNGKIILCIHNKAPNPGLADILRKTFENEGVAVLEAEDLD